MEVGRPRFGIDLGFVWIDTGANTGFECAAIIIVRVELHGVKSILLEPSSKIECRCWCWADSRWGHACGAFHLCHHRENHITQLLRKRGEVVVAVIRLMS